MTAIPLTSVPRTIAAASKRRFFIDYSWRITPSLAVAGRVRNFGSRWTASMNVMAAPRFYLVDLHFLVALVVEFEHPVHVEGATVAPG